MIAAAIPLSVVPGHARAQGIFGSGPVVKARASEPVVITGAQIPSWSRPAATGQPAPYPSGVQKSANPAGDNTRSAHNGFIQVPTDPARPTGVDPDQIAAYRWDGSGWSEIPVQVDQMYLYFLANGHSSFSVYSGTDTELTYAWNPTAHSTGEEAWKKVFGGIKGADTECNARYQKAGAAGDAEMTLAVNNGVVSQPTLTGIQKDDYHGPMKDPVDPAAGPAQLNDDDQIAMMAGDAGLFAPLGTPQPAGTFANNGQQITIVDPTAAQDGSAPTSYIYLFLKPGGSSFSWNTNPYVQMTRDNNADEWVDRYSWSPGDPERIGISNTGYGPNIGGEVCRTAHPNDANPQITTPDGTARDSIDRQPRDGMTVTTPTYTVHGTGRWMVRSVGITPPGGGSYGPNLISRWKGRAFQSSPNSSISLVGFEDEQTNWELNSTLLGWKVGPVRAIREIWGADSGTNVTKTELYYRDGYDFSYHVRVHPIPPDGLYTSWDYRYGYVDTYYNQKNQNGIPIDGRNTQNAGEVDQLPVTGQPAFFNTCVPTQDICSAIDNPEEISGKNGSLVFIADLTGPTALGHPAVVPYYRDDACFDDGTGDSPVPRPWPGESSTDVRVQTGYVSYWQHQTGLPLTYADLKCAPPPPGDPHYQEPGFATYNTMPFQAAIGEMGLHFFFTGDSDNAFVGVPLDELDAEQWVYTVPSSVATNFISPATSPQGQDYGLNVTAPLQTFAMPFSSRTQGNPAVPEVPAAALIPLAAVAAFVPARYLLRRRARA
jgi:hypothetical protein